MTFDNPKTDSFIYLFFFTIFYIIDSMRASTNINKFEDIIKYSYCVYYWDK